LCEKRRKRTSPDDAELYEIEVRCCFEKQQEQSHMNIVTTDAIDCWTCPATPTCMRIRCAAVLTEACRALRPAGLYHRN